MCRSQENYSKVSLGHHDRSPSQRWSQKIPAHCTITATQIQTEGWCEAERNLQSWALCATHRHHKSISRPVVRPETYRTKGLAMYAECTLKLSHMTCAVAFSISLGVRKSIREQSGILFRRNTEFVEESVVQDFLHVVAIHEHLWHASKACRIGGQALGARYTACSMIPGNGVYRVRRRRSAEVRSGSTTRGSKNRSVSVSKRVSCSRKESSLLASESRRLLGVDVKLELVISK